jgi:hypothetical protein
MEFGVTGSGEKEDEMVFCAKLWITTVCGDYLSRSSLSYTIPNLPWPIDWFSFSSCSS